MIDSNDMPILQLDSGAHMALIKGIAFTPDGTQLVSASDDKTIRVWDWKSGKTVRIIRGNVGLSHEGKYFSMALSPDGRWIAAGGWLHKECAGRCGEIRLFDFSTGQLVGAAQKGHVGVVSGLAFSRDGKLLMSGSGLQDLTAIIWDVDNRQHAASAARPHRPDLRARLLAGQGARLFGRLRQDREDVVRARRQGDR